MKYKYGERRRAGEYERALVEFWEKDGTFQKSVEKGGEDYVFYDGPPFITGNPHHGTLLSSVVKDAVPRFWTMRGRRVERRWGWDCHGLPAENFTEKHLGGTVSRSATLPDALLSHRMLNTAPSATPGALQRIDTEPPKQLLQLKKGDQTTTISLEEYVNTAKGLMVVNSASWKGTVDRIGRWVEYERAYKTMDKDFMESVWWAFKELYDKGKIYEGERVLMYDTTFATPVSKNEVTMDNDAYRTVTDPSAFVKFSLKTGQKCHNGEWEVGEDTYLLAWTTTPWTLPGNMALAVNPEMKYAELRVSGGSELFIVASALVEKIFEGHEIEIIYDDILGSDLVGLKYEDLFNDGEVHEVYGAEFVGEGEGTGIVHVAPAYGEDDFELAKKEGIGVRHAIDDNGYYLPEFASILHEIGVRDTDERGIEVWAANKFIAKCLQERGVVWRIDYVKHEYPFNPRSGQRIMYRAIPSWFFNIQDSKELMLEKNKDINWFPEYLKEGRFAKNIEQAPDWSLSRDRFWATAMPVWKGDKGTVRVVGSYDELFELSGVRLPDYHRPWVDEVEFDLVGGEPVWNEKGLDSRVKPENDGQEEGDPEDDEQREHFVRVDKVLDCWFESGSMPFAQLHYPFENKEKFEKNYPADFIVEYVGQVRAWFYYLHAVNTALFEGASWLHSSASADALLAHRTPSTAHSATPASLNSTSQKTPMSAPFKNVIVTGTLAGNDGRKMSKSLGNFTDPNELMDKFSADALRFLMLSSPVLSGEDFALLDKDVGDTQRKLNMIWNVYDFFTMYAEVDDWELKGERARLKNLKNPLDIWIISRLHQLKVAITINMEAYNIPDALSGVLPFVDDVSNWFVRRSRRRFWKSDDDSDKNDAYTTLYTVLEQMALILAPFTPFLAEELWQNLVGEGSVHLQDWPGGVSVDEDVLNKMFMAREVIKEGLAQRMNKSEVEEQIKVRQPLSELRYGGEKLDEFYENMIADEVNVKKVIHDGDKVLLNKELTQELRDEGFVRELVRFVQAARRQAGLNVDDRIKLGLSEEVFGEFREMLMGEVLAEELVVGGNYDYDEIVNVEGLSITISLEKT